MCGKVAQWVNELAAEPDDLTRSDDLSVIPGTNTMGGEN